MKSMTAYAYVYKKKGQQSIQLILRALNHKYQEIFVHNLGGEKILLEEKVKKEIKKKVYRGRIEVYIFLEKPQGRIYIDEGNLKSYLSQIRKIARKLNLKDTLSATDVLNLPHVVCYRESKEGEDALVLPALKEGLRRLIVFKEKEGRDIKRQMAKNLKKLKENVKRIGEIKPKPKVAEANSKEDIEEEISLTSFYIKKLCMKINSNGLQPVGKYIDFLSQEILRELNAASSKTKDARAASLIVEAKNYLERIREQAQNVE